MNFASQEPAQHDWASLPPSARLERVKSELNALVAAQRIKIPSKSNVDDTAALWVEFHAHHSPQMFVDAVTMSRDDTVNLTDFSEWNFAYRVVNPKLYQIHVSMQKELGGVRAWIGSMDSYKQASGNGRVLAGKQMQFLRNCSVASVTLGATSIGGYFWARMGFVPRDWEKTKKEITEKIVKIGDEVKKELFMSSKQKRKIIFALAKISAMVNLSNDAKTIWDIADGKGIYGPDNEGAVNYEKKPLHQYLMIRAGFSDGEFSFNDQDQVNRLEAYIGPKPKRTWRNLILG